MSAQDRSQRGFTLLEVILVVLIFAIMAAMAYGGLNSVLKTRTAIERSMQRTADYQKAYMRMRTDFQNLAIRPIRDNFGDVQPALKGGEEIALEMTRGGWRNPLYLKRSSMERVVYALHDHKLERASYRVLDRAQDSEPVRVVLLDGVRELKWRYLDRNREWVTQWPPQTQDQSTSDTRPDDPPPLAVEMTLETEDLGELRFVFAPGAEPVPADLNRFAPPTENEGDEQTDPGPSDGDVPPPDPDAPVDQ